jgi:hypothetical protein
VAEHFTRPLRRAAISDSADRRLRRIADDASDLGTTHELNGDKNSGRARRWKRIADVLALCSAVLAFTAGIVELAWSYRPATVALALAAAAVSALLAGLRPVDRAAAAKACAGACWGISGEVRDFNHMLPAMPVDEAAKALSLIRKRAQQVSGACLDVGPNPQT